MQLGESLVWDAARALLYWVDIPGQAVHRLHPATGDHASWDMPAEPGCIALHADGGLVVALRSGLMHLDTSHGGNSSSKDKVAKDSVVLRLLQAPPYDVATTRFNDGRCDAAGRLWTGSLYAPRDKPAASLYCFERGILRDAGLPVTTSNGVAFSPAGDILYHADTPAHRITAYDYDMKTGSIGNGRLFHQFSDDRTDPGYGGRPDGASVDSEGYYWCAMFEGGRVLRLAPDGTIAAEILLPVRCPTMVAFGGEDLRTLFITSGRNNRSAEELAQHPLSGHLLSTRVAVAGCPEFAYIA